MPKATLTELVAATTIKTADMAEPAWLPFSVVAHSILRFHSLISLHKSQQVSGIYAAMEGDNG